MITETNNIKELKLTRGHNYMHDKQDRLLNRKKSTLKINPIEWLKSVNNTKAARL